MDERWALQGDELRRALIDAVPGASRVTVAQPGMKGGAESIILALGSIGMVSAVVSCFRLWLDRDQSREIRVAWTKDGVEESITVTGKGMSGSALDKLADAMARRIGQ